MSRAAHAPKSAAERSRERYWRDKLGLKLFTLELPERDLAEALMCAGWLPRPASGAPTEAQIVAAMRRLFLVFIGKNRTREVNILQETRRGAMADREHGEA